MKLMTFFDENPSTQLPLSFMKESAGLSAIFLSLYVVSVVFVALPSAEIFTQFVTNLSDEPVKYILTL